MKKSGKKPTKFDLDKMRYAKILEAAKRDRKSNGYQNHNISLWKINILSQPRKTFDLIDEMADSIADGKLINPLTVARFNVQDFLQYVDMINRLWKTSYILNDMHSVKEKGAKYYYVLLGGERRTRGMKLLWTNGCINCRTSFGQEKAGTCFKRHFPSDKIDVRFRPDVNPIEAVFVQFQENTYRRVPPDEEAQAYDNYFRFLRQIDPKFPLASFARKVGRSPETIKNALRFCELPNRIQDIVRDHKGKYYNLAVQVSRLHRACIDPETVELWMLRGIVEGIKSYDFQKSITRYLEDLNNGQLSLLNIFSENQEREFQRNQIRRIVSANTLMAVHSWITYLQTVLNLFETERLGRKDSPFSHKSPVKVYAKLFGLMQKLAGHFQKVGPIKFKKVPEEIGEMESIIRLILKEDKK